MNDEGIAYMQQANASLDLVREIANDYPIDSGGCDGETNYCKYCQSTWAEDSYDEYVANVVKLEESPEAMGRGVWPIKWEHHESDCLWVRANQIVR